MMSETKETLYLSVEGSWDAYIPYEIFIEITKNEASGKFLLNDVGMESSPWHIRKEYETFENAFQYLIDHTDYSFCSFQINEIKPNLVFFYTKKLIENLNSCYHKDFEWLSIEKYKEGLPLDTFKEKLGINIKMVKDAKKKRVQVIKLTKIENGSNEVKKFLIGKISTEGNMIKINDEYDNIIYLTTGDNITIKTELINNDYYWYFTK